MGLSIIPYEHAPLRVHRVRERKDAGRQEILLAGNDQSEFLSGRTSKNFLKLFSPGRLVVALPLLALQLLLLHLRRAGQKVRPLLQLKADFIQHHQQHVSCIDRGRKFIQQTSILRVVTGLRFYKQNRIIHLQIQEGQLLERGKINATTTRWVPVEDYTIYDKGIRDGRDYHTLAWDRREVDLDDLTAPVGHVVVS